MTIPEEASKQPDDFAEESIDATKKNATTEKKQLPEASKQSSQSEQSIKTLVKETTEHPPVKLDLETMSLELPQEPNELEPQGKGEETEAQPTPTSSGEKMGEIAAPVPQGIGEKFQAVMKVGASFCFRATGRGYEAGGRGYKINR